MIVVKHQYFSRRDRQSRGAGKVPKVAAVERALAHVKYIQHRPGADCDEGGRELFSDLEDRLDGKVVRKAIREQQDNKVVAHKLTLAPEIGPADKKAFTREVMHRLGSENGLDLQWVAVEHNNTDHHHVHIVVLGRDKNGQDVRFGKRDYSKIKEFGDRYLERNHPYEFEKSRQKRERKELERTAQRQRERELSRQERIKDGRELPSLHRMILREQQEPYAEWKKDQDQKERTAPTKAESEDKQVTKKDRNSIDWKGEKYSKSDSYDRLKEFDNALRQNKNDRLPKDDYRRLRGWIETGDRERFSGVVDKQLTQAKQQDDRRQEKLNSPTAQRWVDPVQQQVMANPVIGVFMAGASVVNTVVSWIDLRDNRDRLKEAGEALESAKRDKHADYLKRDKSKDRARDEQVIDKIDRALADNDEAHKKRDEDRKRNRGDRGKYDPFTFDPWGRF